MNARVIFGICMILGGFFLILVFKRQTKHQSNEFLSPYFWDSTFRIGGLGAILMGIAIMNIWNFALIYWVTITGFFLVLIWNIATYVSPGIRLTAKYNELIDKIRSRLFK